MSTTRLGVDVGGTFTDLVALSKGELVTAKVPSTPKDQSEGVMNAIDASDVEPASLAALAHGMTVATNALLERNGARTALVTTEGFKDVLEIARQNRPSLYDLTQDRPPPSSRGTCASRLEREWDPKARSKPSTKRAWTRPSRPSARLMSRRLPCACSSPSCTRITNRGSGRRCARRTRTCTSL